MVANNKGSTYAAWLDLLSMLFYLHNLGTRIIRLVLYSVRYQSFLKIRVVY